MTLSTIRSTLALLVVLGFAPSASAQNCKILVGYEGDSFNAAGSVVRFTNVMVTTGDPTKPFTPAGCTWKVGVEGPDAAALKVGGITGWPPALSGDVSTLNASGAKNSSVSVGYTFTPNSGAARVAVLHFVGTGSYPLDAKFTITQDAGVATQTAANLASFYRPTGSWSTTQAFKFQTPCVNPPWYPGYCSPLEPYILPLAQNPTHVGIYPSDDYTTKVKGIAIKVLWRKDGSVLRVLDLGKPNPPVGYTKALVNRNWQARLWIPGPSIWSDLAFTPDYFTLMSLKVMVYSYDEAGNVGPETEVTAQFTTPTALLDYGWSK